MHVITDVASFTLADNANEEPIFYRRFYDWDLLKKNLVAASGLQLVSLNFIEERCFSPNPRRRLANYIGKTPGPETGIRPFLPVFGSIFLVPAKIAGAMHETLHCLSGVAEA